MAQAKFDKPFYINPAGRRAPPDLPSIPPFVFNNVTTRAFPLKANPAQLQQFCDDYLNNGQPFVQFRPSLPFVYLMVLNYGRMSSASVRAQNVGWVAQHEVTFTIALERWNRVGDQWVFANYASLSPFLFVDNPLSETTGREVYGWPKILGVVEAEVPLWAADPRSPTRVFSLQVPMFPKLFAGAREELRDLIQIDRDPVPRFSEFPPDLDNPWNPLAILPNAARSWLGLMGISAELVLRSPARGYRGGWNRETLGGLSKLVRSGLAEWLPTASRLLLDPRRGGRPAAEAEGLPTEDGLLRHRLTMETITLKQFRDSQQPDQACYQAIVSAPMGIARVNRYGLLGDYNLLRGDTHGGYTIRLHRYAAQPIVETLGLEVAAVEEGDDAPIAILKPTLPFWTDVDVHYGLGDVICARSQCGRPQGGAPPWTAGGTSARTNPASRSDASASDSLRPEHAKSPGIPYNTAQGGATQPITGPFHFPDVTLQVYPLLADRDRLQALLDDTLNQPLAPPGDEPLGMRFEAFGSYVYLLVSVQGGQIGIMWSETNNIGWWADKEVSFCVPVKCYRRKSGAETQDSAKDDWDLISLGMVSPFIFGNSGRAVITDREVNGRPTVRANIESPPDAWLTPSGPIADRQLLKLETEVFPALHLGQRAEQRTLLEIDGKEVMPAPYRPDDAQWSAMLEHWGERFVQELHRKTAIHQEFDADINLACGLAPELLCLDAPFNTLHLKQYRDASEPDNACYQALVKTSRHVTRLHRLDELDQRIHIRLHNYPALPIADTLGLKVKHVDSTGGSVVQVLEPVRPFWMRVGLREHLGEVLCWRTENCGWTPTHPWVSRYPTASAPAAPPYFLSGGRSCVVQDGPKGSPGHPFCRERLEPLRRVLEDECMAIQQHRANAGVRAAAPAPPPPPSRSEASRSVRELYAMMDAWLASLTDTEAPGPSQRLSRREAGEAIARLPEIQVAIEALLGLYRAENEGSPCRPAHHIPSGSLPEEWAKKQLTPGPGGVWMSK